MKERTTTARPNPARGGIERFLNLLSVEEEAVIWSKTCVQAAECWKS